MNAGLRGRRLSGAGVSPGPASLASAVLGALTIGTITVTSIVSAVGTGIPALAGERPDQAWITLSYITGGIDSAIGVLGIGLYASDRKVRDDGLGVIAVGSGFLVLGVLNISVAIIGANNGSDWIDKFTAITPGIIPDRGGNPVLMLGFQIAEF